MIYEFSPFFNENLIGDLKLKESSNWVDRIVYTESDMDFKYNYKGYLCELESERLQHNRISGRDFFRPDYLGVSRRAPFIRKKNCGWHNERAQRNSQVSVSNIDISDNDILIFSDVDEIIDHRYFEGLIEMAELHGCVTIKMRFFCYFFNVLSTNWHQIWPGSPADYAYRVFIMTGRYYRSIRGNIDRLRKRGESGLLYNSIPCFPYYAGFHYSWIGGVDAVARKLRSYAHAINDHGFHLAQAHDEDNLEDYVHEQLFSGNSIFLGTDSSC